MSIKIFLHNIPTYFSIFWDNYETFHSLFKYLGDFSGVFLKDQNSNWDQLHHKMPM